MGLTVAAGSNSLSGTYIPEIWAPKLLVKFYERTVLNQIANTDYEGEIKAMGDKVVINNRPTITISDYIKGQELDYEDPVPTSVDLDIDKGKKYAFSIPDVDVSQSLIKFVSEWADDGSKNLKIQIETGIYGDIYADADASNAGNTAGAISGDIKLGITGAPVALTASTIIDYILGMGVVLDEQNIPDEDRWLLLPAWACSRLKNSDLKQVQITGDDKSTLRTGLIGMLDRFKIFQTNLLDLTGTGTEVNIMAGHTSALTFAAQLVKNEVVNNPYDFGKLARGLCIYGYAVPKPTALVHGIVDKA